MDITGVGESNMLVGGLFGLTSREWVLRIRWRSLGVGGGAHPGPCWKRRDFWNGAGEEWDGCVFAVP
jgi:hypothetical protein